jgi:hypothetical protein
VSLPGTTNLDESSALPSDDQFNDILDSLNNFLGKAVNSLGDIPELFDSAIGETFGSTLEQRRFAHDQDQSHDNHPK